jgi:hypothetical protein
MLQIKNKRKRHFQNIPLRIWCSKKRPLGRWRGRGLFGARWWRWRRSLLRSNGVQVACTGSPGYHAAVRCCGGYRSAPAKHPLGARTAIRANLFRVGVRISRDSTPNLSIASTSKSRQVLAGSSLLNPLRCNWRLILSQLSRAFEGGNSVENWTRDPTGTPIGLSRGRLGV